MGSYVGIDLHRQRSVIVVLDDDGNRVSWSRIDNNAVNLAREIAAAGAEAEVAMEACWGWYWAADVIAECGARLHLAHPSGIAGYANRRVKNDIRDATLLADLLRMGRLPEAWVAPPAVRQLREEVRYRHKLSRLQTGLKCQVHQVLGKEGVIPEMKGIWWSGGPPSPHARLLRAARRPHPLSRQRRRSVRSGTTRRSSSIGMTVRHGTVV